MANGIERNREDRNTDELTMALLKIASGTRTLYDDGSRYRRVGYADLRVVECAEVCLEFFPPFSFTLLPPLPNGSYVPPTRREYYVAFSRSSAISICSSICSSLSLSLFLSCTFFNLLLVLSVDRPIIIRHYLYGC